MSKKNKVEVVGYYRPDANPEDVINYAQAIYEEERDKQLKKEGMIYVGSCRLDETEKAEAICNKIVAASVGEEVDFSTPIE